MIGDEEIAWTQHGIVNGTRGQQIGTYDRIVEFGWEEGKDQVMLVYVR